MITLPVGTRIQVIDTTNLRVQLGERATLSWAYQPDDLSFWCRLDDDHMDTCLPVEQCEVIIDGKGVALGKKYFVSKGE